MSDGNYAEWLSAQFSVHKDKAKADLARALGLEPPAISKILNGTRQIKAHEYSIMRRFFGLPVDGERAAMLARTPHTSPSYQGKGQELSEGECHNQTESQWVIPAALQNGQSQTQAHMQPQAQSLQNFIVSDHFMEPDFTRDSTVLVNLSDTLPSPAGVFVVSDKFSHMLRHCKIIPRSNPAEVEITASECSFQPQTLKLEDFEIIGRVVAKLDWV